MCIRDRELSDRETLVKRVKIVPLEVIVRNVAAGSFSKRFGVEEGTVLKCPTLEFCLKDDDLHDPMINGYHILALDLATQNELDVCLLYTSQTRPLRDPAVCHLPGPSAGGVGLRRQHP